MRLATVRPTGIERTFGADEIIVSKTDPKGIITYANSVFLRVAGYTESEVIGQPHNLIRHPDMPRCVFKLMWDTIAAGDEMFAYVVNLAADGAHYWVYAHITPSFGPDGRILGYHSNRRLPDRRAIDLVSSVYAALRAEEQRQPTSQTALQAGSALLAATLAEHRQTYDEFVWDLEERGTALVGAGR